VKTKVSNLQINVADGGDRQAAWEHAARVAGFTKKSQWAASVLDQALSKTARAKLPPIAGPGRPPKKVVRDSK